jgi:transposase
MAQRWIEKDKFYNGMVFLIAFCEWKAVLVAWSECAINNLTLFWPSDMLTSKQEVSTMDSRDSKRKLLKQVRGIHGNPERVRSTLFQSHPFFDAEDKAQVKYEMLRRREVQRAGLVETCTAFGFTRESYRHILDRFQREGMAGLFERKPGRKGPLKVTDEVRNVLEKEHEDEPQLSPEELARRCYDQTGVKLSRRTIYRLREEQGGQKKKPLRKQGS